MCTRNSTSADLWDERTYDEQAVPVFTYPRNDSSEMQNVPDFRPADSHRNGLAMADAIVRATAQDQEAEVVTGDADLKDLTGVIYVK